MSDIIILDSIRDINNKIEREIEFYTEQLNKAETRLSILQEERRQLIELLCILEQEKNK